MADFQRTFCFARDFDHLAHAGDKPIALAADVRHQRLARAAQGREHGAVFIARDVVFGKVHDSGGNSRRARVQRVLKHAARGVQRA